MSKLYDIFLKYPKISTDTRKIERNSIFFALRGASFDGNAFALEALERGAAYAVVDDAALPQNERLILVDDALSALQNLAREHRQALAIPIIAISGSNGKTTTKELLHSVLSQKFMTYATRGNLNNHIGVPLTLLSMDATTELGIVEMGASAQGEIALLCDVAQPNYGMLTNVGRAHLEGFGGEDGVRRGKGELYDYLAATEGVAFVMDEDAPLREMASERSPLKVHRYSVHLADGVKSHLEGDYNRFNVAAAIAVGEALGVERDAIFRAIEGYEPQNNRSQRLTTPRNTLIVDCYNANPSSVKASIDNFIAESSAGRSSKALILGDMMELGEWSEEEHKKALFNALQGDIAQIFVVGEHFARATEQLLQSEYVVPFVDCEALCERLKTEPLNDAIILIKGSRSIGLERTIEYL